MQRRKFMLGLGATAAGSSALVGSGAFSGVVSERTASVQIAHDKNAYLGLKETDHPNESYVDYDDLNHLRIRMDRTNPNTEIGGTGVNSNSYTWFNHLFRICNQGKQPIKFFFIKIGKHPKRVFFYEHTDRKNACWATTVDVGDCVDIGMATWTYGLSSPTQLLDKVLIVALGTEDYNTDPQDFVDEENGVNNNEHEVPV